MTTPIAPLPTAPTDRTDPAVFNEQANAFADALNPWGISVQTVGDEAEAAAVTAELQVGLATAQAVAAAASAAAAAASALTAGAIAWVTGTTYTTGDVRYSPINFQAYRRKTNGAGSIDPSIDSTNWVLAIAPPAGASLFINTYGGF